MHNMHMGRQRKAVKVDIPLWVVDETDLCLQSTATDAYTAKAMAAAVGAARDGRCTQLMRAGDNSLKVMADRKAGKGKRCSEGDRAARKFWEAKVCARAKRG